MTAPQVLPPEKARPTFERVAVQIVDYIHSERLSPGDKLPTERQLRNQLGVGPTVLREAIKALEATGVLRARQGSGIYLTDGSQRPLATAAINLSISASPEDISGLFEFRIALESNSARLAAQRATPRELLDLQEIVSSYHDVAARNDVTRVTDLDLAFHTTIARASHNSLFEQTLTTTMRLNSWAINLVVSKVAGSLKTTAQQHEVIFKAIRSGNPDLASQAMQGHIEESRSNYQKEIQRRINSLAIEVKPES
jgi:GntR family transcriptional regulator, transcriptional repressor for pyruvate dehydrogenase complex